MKNAEKKESVQNVRHTCAHLLAAAVLELYPHTKLTIGPAIENGFYYDFAFEHPISEDDFGQIYKKMADIIKTWDTFSHRVVSKVYAQKIDRDHPYRL